MMVSQRGTRGVPAASVPRVAELTTLIVSSPRELFRSIDHTSEAAMVPTS